MKQSKGILMVKPDALQLIIVPSLCLSLLKAFINHLTQSKTYKLTIDEEEIYNKAVQQIYERSLKELLFQGTVKLDSSSLSKKLDRVVISMKADSITALEIIILGLGLMDCEILSQINCTLTEKDIDKIYSLTNDCNVNFNLRRSLQKYLMNNSVVLIKLNCFYGQFLLQHWKTFVRHFLIKDRTEKDRLVNLLHVCEEDYAYVNGLIYNKENDMDGNFHLEKW